MPSSTRSETENSRLPRIEDYEEYIGAEQVDRILEKAHSLRDLHVVNINSTYYGGGVAELLGTITMLLNSAGIKTGWRVLQGSPDFFSITKKMHNAMQGDAINLTARKQGIYEAEIYQNAFRNHIDHDVVIVHDPQPLPMIRHYRKRGPWIWRCHVDVTHPHGDLWKYLRQFVEKYDLAIFSLKDYQQKDLKTPQHFMMPAIDPFSIKNRQLSDEEMDERLEHHKIPTDLPLVVQISRFDRWKDPQGVIEAFQIARKQVDCTLVLLGNIATDDPEGQELYNKLRDYQEERLIVLSKEDTALVNALQTKATVVLQKSLREGFGLTVTEAMWKRSAVIGGNTGGIRYQIEDGKTGFLVSSVEEAAERIVRLLKDGKLRKQLGNAARESVKKQFLMTRYVEQYFDVFNSFETNFKMKQQ